MKSNNIGIGNEFSSLKFYIQNRPPLVQYSELNTVNALACGDITAIGQQTGNHWRKIFNVYAKLMFELDSKSFNNWQSLRDNSLLQKNNDDCLLFSPPELTALDTQQTHIVLGKGYATKLGLAAQCQWLSNDFAINNKHRLIICPYFDYRQLSNIKITQLAQLIRQTSLKFN